MIIVLSPAKTLDYSSSKNIDDYSSPVFLNKSKDLIGELKKKNPSEISKLMKLSDKLTSLNVERYRTWKAQKKPSDNSKQSIYVFKGDVYQGLDIESFSKKDTNFAQKHLRILSGLYGILKPLDIIEPYRLEMGTKITLDDSKNLYEFWKNKVTTFFNDEIVENELFINLASNEYSSAIDKKSLNTKMVSPIFKDFKKIMIF